MNTYGRMYSTLAFFLYILALHKPVTDDRAHVVLDLKCILPERKKTTIMWLQKAAIKKKYL